MNLNEDWYQSAVKKFGIKEITENFDKKGRIGYGSSGFVYKTKCDSIGILAIKEAIITSDDDSVYVKHFINELKIYSRINHDRIIHFYGISRKIDEGLYYIVLEYANQGNLREFIKKKKHLFEWKERIHIATQIAEGLQYLHNELNIAHRDLHTKNILVNNGNIKISDFGLSKNLNSTTTSDNKIIGIVSFIDPQKLDKGKNFILDKRSDIYSLGMVLWEISSCRIPFPNEESVHLSLAICNGLREKPVKGTPTQYIRIYTNCWQQEPDSRLLIDQILSQLWSISLEPVLEDSDENLEENTTNYLEKLHEISKDSISVGYSSNLSSLIIPDDLTTTRKFKSMLKWIKLKLKKPLQSTKPALSQVSTIRIKIILVKNILPKISTPKI